MNLKKALIEIEESLSQHVSASRRCLKSEPPEYADFSDYKINIEPSEKHVQVIYKGITLASSKQTLLVRESFHTPVLYMPPNDVQLNLMKRSCQRTYCPCKGYASYWSLIAKEKVVKNAFLSYEEPFRAASRLKGYITLNWKQIDFWYKDSELLFLDIDKPVWIGSNISPISEYVFRSKG